MSLKSVLITGSNRGIGLEMIRQLVGGRTALGSPRHVFACCRDPAKAVELKSVADECKPNTKVHVVTLDVTNDNHITDAAKLVDSVVGQDGLNLLINNAAMLQREGSQLPTVDRANLLRHFDVNVVSPILIAQAFLPLLRRASALSNNDQMSVYRSAVINISSGAGSIGMSRNDNLKLGLGYRISKAALNMATKSMSIDLAIDNPSILVVSIEPGWVRTDMGGATAFSTPQESVSTLFATMARLNEKQNGGFFRRDGRPIEF